jgi:hypothetical protein
MTRRLLAATAVLASLAPPAAAGAATVDLQVRGAGGDDVAEPFGHARDGVVRWHVTSDRGIGLTGTFRDDLGTIPYGAQCHLLVRNLATGKERRDDDCVADSDGTFSTGASPRQHVRVRVVIERDTSDAEHPIAADTVSAPVELRVRPWVELRDVYTGGRLLDGRLVIRFNAVVDDSPGIRKGRLFLQRKAGAGFVTVGSKRIGASPYVTFEAIAPKVGQYRVLWKTATPKLLDDAPSKLLPYRR